MQFKLDEFDESGLEQIIPDWVDLCNNCLNITPFQLPQWIIPWWKHFGSGRIIVLTVRYGNVLTGAAFLYVYNIHNTNKLCFIGTGISDYLDIIALPGYEMNVAESILSYIADIRSQWDECDLHDIPENSVLLHCNYPDAFIVKKSEWNVCSHINLPDNTINLKSTFPRNLRKSLSHAARHLFSHGGYRVVKADKSNFDFFLYQLFRLHYERWKSKSQHGVLGSDKLKYFHHDVSCQLIENDHIRLYMMLHDKNPISVYYTLVQNRIVYGYLSGFDPSMSKYSPGSLLLFHIIEDSLQKGAIRFDFLRGGESYKNHWRPLIQINSRIQLLKEKLL